MKRIIKNNYKLIVGIVIGIIISVSGVYAATTIIKAIEVSYDNHEEKYTTKTTVQDSIDELYKRNGVHDEKWVDKTLNGADPVLKDPLIPVDIKPNGEVYYANENSEWYNYSEKRWANAVILVDKPSKKYTTGEKIEEDDIESYFVWIPRYKYKVWDLGKYDKAYTLKDITDDDKKLTAETALWKLAGNNSIIIDIIFGNEDYVKEDYTKEEEKTIQGSGISGGDEKVNVGDYLIHPAFKLGDKVLNGIWVGKFETGGTINNIVVKPNVTSLRNQTSKVFFDSAKSYEETLDSHMMKNTEWGAVAYLSHSAYGIGTEVRINNASGYMTGYSAVANTNQNAQNGIVGSITDKSKTQPWNSATGYLASTSGNINGVYDMNGGSYESMAACIEGTPGNDSGFDEQTLAEEMENGYIDKYSKDSTVTSYNKRILGDATGEMGPFYNYSDSNGAFRNHSSWYGDYTVFIESSGPWFGRSSDYSNGVLSGPFYFTRGPGIAAGNTSFRLVLSPTE